MDLLPGGIDVFYIDESAKHPLYGASAIAVPFLRSIDGSWKFVWQDYLKAAIDWRRSLSHAFGIRFRQEMHAYQLLKAQGLYLKTWKNLSPAEAVDVYRSALSKLDFLPDSSIISAYATDQSTFAGQSGMGACLLALFQRMRSQCLARKTNALIFFDEGHREYISAFRKAQAYLPTGSALGGWGNGQITKNMHLSMFPKDANIKQSDLSYFIQMADLVAYAARMKIEYEQGGLAQKRVNRGHHQIYDAIPRNVINLRASRKRSDGIAKI
jgi:hypothetical protein